LHMPATSLGGQQNQQRPQPLSTAQQAVAHRFQKGRRHVAFPLQVTGQGRLD